MSVTSMIDIYAVADNWNNVAGLALLNPQPRNSGGLVLQGIQYAVLRDGGDGSLAEDGAFAEIYYVGLTIAERNSLDAQFGVATASTNQITVRLRVTDNDFDDFNAIVKRPQNGKTAKRVLNGWRDVTYLLVRLRAI
jgi:hypothetical protein